MTDSLQDQIEKIEKNFAKILESGEPYDLEQLVSAVPPRYREIAIKSLIPMEVEYYRKQNWTYSKLSQRQQQFPQLRKFIGETVSGSRRESVEDLEKLVATRHQRFADCKYSSDSVVFAEGGQGALYKGTDLILGERDVAIKVVKDAFDSNKFRQEAEVTAKLEHPGIVAVYSYSADGRHAEGEGTPASGRPFYAMRLIHGQPLTELIGEYHNAHAEKPIRLSQDPKFIALIESLVSACHVVSYAHSVGVLHCDLKPQNIMAGEFGATTVLDWGSAVSVPNAKSKIPNEKRVSCPDWTNESQFTEAYASPEQKGETHTRQRAAPSSTNGSAGTIGNQPDPAALTESSDVFSLGATLYQIITGRTPIDLPDYKQRKAQDEIGSVRSANSRCSKRLEAICVKAMRLNPADRYDSPESLAQDLTAWLRGDRISAKPDNLFDYIFRVLNRHRLAAMLTMLALLMAGGFYYKYTIDKIDKLRLESSLDSGYSLIEKFCEPLENGELQDPDSLRDVVRLVDQQTASQLNSPDHDVTELMRGRLHFLSALAKFFYANYDTPQSGIEPIAEHSEKNTDEAIASIDQAIEYFRSSNNANEMEYVNDRLARSCLFKARLHFVKTGETSTNDEDVPYQFDESIEAIDCAQNLLSSKGRQNSNESERFRLAESYQLLGEVHYRKVTQSFTSNVDADFRKSENAFKECIAELHDIETLEQYNDQACARALGRGYGYLGDVLRDQGKFDEAFESYKNSLEYRKSIYDNNKSPENQFQLARGYANFIRTLRYLGVAPNGDSPGAENLDSMPVNQRSTKVIKTLERYMGSEEEGDAKALRLYRQMAMAGVKTARREYGDILCTIAELYLYAAKQAEDNNELRLQCLKLAEDFATRAEQQLEPFFEEHRNEQTAKTALAYSKTMLLKIRDANQQETGDLQPRILQLLPNINDEGVSADELLLRCIAFASRSDSFAIDLQEGMEKLAVSGKKMDWRIRQHFEGKPLEIYNNKINALDEHNDSSESPGLQR